MKTPQIYLQNEKRGNKEQITVMVPTPMIREYETVAKKTGYTFSQIVRAAMTKFMEDLNASQNDSTDGKRKSGKQMSFLEVA